jgi:hypothetical protein
MKLGLLFASALISVAYCGTISFSAQAQNQHIYISQVNKTTPLSSQTSRDKALEKIIRKEFDVDELKKAGVRIAYTYYKYDLNGDNIPEIIISLHGIPYCNSSGCSIEIFQKVGKNYKLITGLRTVNDLIIINKKTSGWNDLVSLGKEGDYQLNKFDGTDYNFASSLGKKAVLIGKSLFSHRKNVFFDF